MPRDGECNPTPSHNINAPAQTVEIARKLKEDLNQMKL